APWRVTGSYFEACSCEAVCPCRQQGGRPGGRSTYGICDFALSWRILDGRAAGTVLSGLEVVLAGSYSDDEAGSPWRVALYVDERADEAQRAAPGVTAGNPLAIRGECGPPACEECGDEHHDRLAGGRAVLRSLQLRFRVSMLFSAAADLWLLRGALRLVYHRGALW